MTPRALTDSEREAQRRRIFTKARELVIAHGVKKVSVDDIAKAAGVGKATFYSHYAGKEKLVLEIIWDIYSDFLTQAEAMIATLTPENARSTIARFIKYAVCKEENIFLLGGHHELEDMMLAMPEGEVQDFGRMEYSAYERLITMLGGDTSVVKPDVVHNCIHGIYFITRDELMMKDNLEETIDVMISGVVTYIFSGVR